MFASMSESRKSENNFSGGKVFLHEKSMAFLQFDLKLHIFTKKTNNLSI